MSFVKACAAGCLLTMQLAPAPYAASAARAAQGTLTKPFWALCTTYNSSGELVMSRAYLSTQGFYVDHSWDVNGRRMDVEKFRHDSECGPFWEKERGPLNYEHINYSQRVRFESQADAEANRARTGRIVVRDWVPGYARAKATEAPAEQVTEEPPSKPAEAPAKVAEQSTEAPSAPPTPPADDAERKRTEDLNGEVLARNEAANEQKRRAEEEYRRQQEEYKRRVAATEAAAAEAKRLYELELASAKAAREKYEREVAAREELIRRMRTKQDREQLVDWKEAVTVCSFDANDGQAKLGNWRCEGPLQMTYAKMEASGPVIDRSLANVALACGGKPESIRDLGLVNGNRVFGCSFGMHPNPRGRLAVDTAERAGIGYVPGRITYRCPRHQSSCRTR